MKVVVTGGSGKAGRWIVRELIAGTDGAPIHHVTVFDRTRCAFGEGVRFLPGDITDLGHVVGALAGADAVIHLAGIPTHSVAPNEETFRINAMGTFNVHEAAWRLGIGRVVTMSSEAVLGWAPGAMVREFVPEYLPIDEDHPVGAQDPYGLSKIACEAIARSYAAKCDMTAVALRPPWIASPEEMLEVHRSGGRPVTEFVPCHYIDARDLAIACRRAIERDLSGYHVMFVGAGETTVDEPLASLFPRMMPAIGDKAAALTGTRAWVSIERAKEILGWSPRISWRRAADVDQPPALPE
jgi:nucleoside-diphosphate-sugar epimerase